MGFLGTAVAVLALAYIVTSDDPVKQEDPTNPLPDRPLFDWGSEADKDSMPQDDPRVHLVLTPGRHYRRSRVQTSYVRSNADEELEKKKKSQKENDTDSNNEMQSDDAYRHYLWAHDLYHRQALVNPESPAPYTLTESQLNWINSLHPELRDRYLQDIYSTRSIDGARAYAYYRSYDDPYRYYYGNYYNRPYYVRQPVSVMVEDPVDAYDYSCYQVDSNNRAVLSRAPRLAHAHIHRYDRRSNPNYPHNAYLTAMYRCDSGYTLLDPNVSELHCRNREWVGTYPRCMPTRS